MRIGEVEQALGISRMTIYRYERLGLLAVARDEAGDRVFAEADLERIKEIRQQVRAGMVEKCRVAQTERLAAQALKEQRLRQSIKELEAKLRQTEAQRIKERVRRILEAYPDTRVDDWELVLTYYRVFHGTENLRAAKADGAPFPDTITRRKRDILQKQEVQAV